MLPGVAHYDGPEDDDALHDPGPRLHGKGADRRLNDSKAIYGAASLTSWRGWLNMFGLACIILPMIGLFAVYVYSPSWHPFCVAKLIQINDPQIPRHFLLCQPKRRKRTRPLHQCDWASAGHPELPGPRRPGHARGVLHQEGRRRARLPARLLRRV